MKISTRLRVSIVGAAVTIATISPFVHAQPAPATASTAATTQPPPRKVVLPPGFKTVTVNGRTAACEPADEAWVSTALLKITSTTRPSTMPAALLQRLLDQRTALLHRLSIDLALTDSSELAKFYDDDLVAKARELDDYRPRVIYLVCTADRLVELMRHGWRDPHFYYNRAADAVSFSPAGSLPIDRPQDEALFPAAFNAKDPPEKREEALKKSIDSIEATIARSIDIRARTLVGSSFALMIERTGLAPLNLSDDQKWFSMGTATYLSIICTSAVTGDSLERMMELFTVDTPNNPLKTSAVDLLHPEDPKQMRPQAVGLYFDAYRRKSTRTIRSLVEKAGEDAIAKSIKAIRAKKPAGGAALVTTIKGATGVDLMPMVGREE